MRVDVSAKHISFPRLCVCCRREPDTQVTISASRSSGKKIVRTETQTWRVPYCSSCLRHIAVWKSSPVFVLAGALVGAIIGSRFGNSSTLGTVLFALCTALGLGLTIARGYQAKKLCCEGCASVGRIAASYIGWDGTRHSFFFVNPTYAAEYMMANSGKLLNVTPDGRRLLDLAVAQKVGQARADTTPTPGGLESRSRTPGSPPSVREDAEYMMWIDKIERAKGPAGRRAALQAALGATSQQHVRDRIMLEASRVEVQAALDKAASRLLPRSCVRSRLPSKRFAVIPSRTTFRCSKFAGLRRRFPTFGRKRTSRRRPQGRRGHGRGDPQVRGGMSVLLPRLACRAGGLGRLGR